MKVAWDHVHLRSADPDAAARFYVEMLGAEPRDRTDAGGQLRVTVDLAGVPLFIDRVPAETAGPPPAPFLGLEHIGLTVAAIDAAVAELKGRGVTITVEPHDVRPGLRIAFVEGPDRVRIELLQRG